MNAGILDLFEPNPLKGVRVCLAGKFKMSSVNLNKQLRAIGVAEPIDHVVSASNDDTNSKPVKEGTGLFVIGTDAPADCIARYELNCHDGYKAVKITEQELYAIMRGELSIDIPYPVKKHINLDYSYFEWTAPSNQLSRKSSPYVFNLESVESPVYGREIYIPDIPGVNMPVFRQIVGDFGGHANTYYNEKTDMILLCDSTIENWKNGIRDEIIQKIESIYNNSDNQIFNIQFCSESHFMEWVCARLKKCPDPTVIALIERMYKI